MIIKDNYYFNKDLKNCTKKIRIISIVKYFGHINYYGEIIIFYHRFLKRSDLYHLTCYLGRYFLIKLYLIVSGYLLFFQIIIYSNY